MNKKTILLTYLLIFNKIFCSAGFFSDFFKVGVDHLAETKSFTAERQKEIETLKKKRITQNEQYAVHKLDLEKFQASLDKLREKYKDFAQDGDLEFVNKYQLFLNQIIQVLTEIDQCHQSIINLLNENIKTLKEWESDPEFKSKNLQVPYKSIYSIDDLQKLNDLLLFYDNKIKCIEERQKKAATDLDNRKKTQILARQEYEEKKKEQKELKSNKELFDSERSQKLSIKQLGELLDAEEIFLFYKKELAKLRVQELEQKLHLVDNELRIVKLQLQMLEKEYERVKNELRIDEKDIKTAENDLKCQIQDSIRKQEEANKKIEALDLLRSREQSQVQQYKKLYELTDADLDAIRNWTMQPTTVKSWAALINTGRITNRIIYELDMSKEDILAQVEYEKAKVTEKEIENLTINSWFKITTGKFDSIGREELLKEIKQYEKFKVDIQARISSITDKKAIAVNELNNNARITENIKSRIKEFKDQKETTFKGNLGEFNRFSIQLKNEAYDDATKRGEFIAQIIELYNRIINIHRLTVKNVDTMIDELAMKLQWAGGVAFWKGLGNFGPDITRFFKFIYEKDVLAVLSTYKQALTDFIHDYQQKISFLISFIIHLIVMILIFILIKIYLPDIINMLNRITPAYGFGYNVSSFLIVNFKFIGNHLASIFTWLIFYYLVKYKLIFDSYVGILFYLISIPFWLIYGYRYIRYIERTNIESDYSLLSPEYHKRFLTVLSVFVYSTIIILFFKEAFVLAHFPKSQMPMTLLALHFIILQICLICILSKEQILKLIPKTSDLWEWVYDQIEQYYYLFLAGIVFIIIMSNPYIGYGLHFFYFISRLILILLLIPFFMAVHGRIKRFASAIFIHSDVENSKERFPYARTAYGIFIILSFLFFIFLMIILAANLWGYPVGLEQIVTWLKTELYGFKNPDTGMHVAVNVLDFGKVLLYIMFGIATAYFINKYVLGRMFDLLLVNVGVQNAILSLVRYSVILASILIGLKTIGLSSFMIYILAIVGGLGVAGKELITDFIGYFVILIQRPIKIGDFVRLDEEVVGVVRHISLRSFALRRKNSVTVIVPNSHVMKRPVSNWNYSRTYFAFDDIILTVPYASDPSLVKDLMLKLLNNNLNILKNPAPIVWLQDFNDNGYQFIVRGYISFDKVLDQWEIASNVRLEIVKVLKENGIEVASPTRILRVIDQKIQKSNLQYEDIEKK